MPDLEMLILRVYLDWAASFVSMSGSLGLAAKNKLKHTAVYTSHFCATYYSSNSQLFYQKF